MSLKPVYKLITVRDAFIKPDRVGDVQKKAALRNTSATQLTPRSSSDSSTDTSVSLPPPRPCPMMPIHTNQPWFHGHISRERSVSLLAEHGLVDGLVLNCLNRRAFADTVMFTHTRTV